MSALYCPECAGEFSDAGALNRHLRFEEKYSPDEAYEEVGNEIARASAKREDLDAVAREAGFVDTTEARRQFRGGRFR
jgi:Zn-finger nucleic acid-binding protein